MSIMLIAFLESRCSFGWYSENKKELSELVERVDDVEILANETADHVLELREEHKQHHNELRESHKELKDKQDKVVDENLEQTKILNRIEERYQTQVDVAQKMKKRHSPKINGS